MKLYKKQIISFLLLSLAFSGILFFRLNSIPANAQFLEEQEGFKNNGPIAEAYGDATGDNRDVRDMVVIYIQYLLTFLALIFMVLVIWSGSRWMMSNGNEEEIKKAKSHLIASIIGMIIVLSAYAITRFIYEFSIDALDNRLP